jgi:hypothetical protein
VAGGPAGGVGIEPALLADLGLGAHPPVPQSPGHR